jgi:hypothetical protein
MLTMQGSVFLGAAFFVLLWMVLFVYHEFISSQEPAPTIHVKVNNGLKDALRGRVSIPPLEVLNRLRTSSNISNKTLDGLMNFDEKHLDSVVDQQHHVTHEHDDGKEDLISEEEKKKEREERKAEREKYREADLVPIESVDNAEDAEQHATMTSQWFDSSLYRHDSKRGILICNGQEVNSEIIYWKDVPGDDVFESPITPHHAEHNDRYLSFEYDNGGTGICHCFHT